VGAQKAALFVGVQKAPEAEGDLKAGSSLPGSPALEVEAVSERVQPPLPVGIRTVCVCVFRNLQEGVSGHAHDRRRRRRRRTMGRWT
jgi:hypothetical protein